MSAQRGSPAALSSAVGSDELLELILGSSALSKCLLASSSEDGKCVGSRAQLIYSGREGTQMAGHCPRCRSFGRTRTLEECEREFGYVQRVFAEQFVDRYLLEWVGSIEPSASEEVNGTTDFATDPPTVRLARNCCDGCTVETLTHELAHVAAGCGAGHNDKWQRIFDDLSERVSYEFITGETSERQGAA